MRREVADDQPWPLDGMETEEVIEEKLLFGG
jgi:hypothetical protein